VLTLLHLHLRQCCLAAAAAAAAAVAGSLLLLLLGHYQKVSVSVQE
jgi:uncharacterized membrane protein